MICRTDIYFVRGSWTRIARTSLSPPIFPPRSLPPTIDPHPTLKTSNNLTTTETPAPTFSNSQRSTLLLLALWELFQRHCAQTDRQIVLHVPQTQGTFLRTAHSLTARASHAKQASAVHECLLACLRSSAHSTLSLAPCHPCRAERRVGGRCALGCLFGPGGDRDEGRSRLRTR